ncbi:MAG: lipopolysaccharide heptosyltransferase I [Candidatus Rokubacteria bacterium]|nr:lipopolysaccharide heptosyltransferase I [Candidatus Rokubacteria bacterium]
MRIGILKLSSLGDVIHALPVAHALRRHFPRAHLTWVAEAREARLLVNHPDLDAVVAVDTRRWRRRFWRPGTAREIGEILRQLGMARLDVALDLQGLIKSGILAAWTRAPLRIGFGPSHLREPMNALFTNRRVVPPLEAVHVVEQYLALLGPLGITDRRPVFTIPLSPDAERWVDAFLTDRGVKPSDRLVALNVGAGRPEKRWPQGHWRRLAEGLAVEAGVRLLVLWGPGEEPLAASVSRGLPTSPLLAPRTTLDELAAFLRRAVLVLAADTGPLHLAAALGTPCVGLYGPTSGARNGPYGGHCRVLESPDGRMASLEPEAVLGAVSDLLASSASAAGGRA